MVKGITFQVESLFKRKHKIKIFKDKTLIDVAEFSESFWRKDVTWKKFVILLKKHEYEWEKTEDQVKLIRDISKKCRSLVVEFPTPCDESFIIRDKGVKISFAKLNIIGKILYKAKLFLRRRVFGYIDNHYGIIGVGSIGYDNCFYFNKKAFDYTFLVHNKIFKKICYKTSPRFPKRLIAFCSV